jgi:hypothetical protein
MIFNRINFHGHLRLSGVCKRWYNLVQNDLLFMRTVEFQAYKMNETHTLMRTYKSVNVSGSWRHQCYRPKNNVIAENFQKLFKNTETIFIGSTTRSIMNSVMALCENLREINTCVLLISTDGNTTLTFQHSLPIKICPMSNMSTELLDCFTVIESISSISIFDSPKLEIVDKYGSKTNSLIVNVNTRRQKNSLLNQLCRYENLQLQSLRFDNYSNRLFEKGSVHSFFKKQAPFVETIKIEGKIDTYIFHSILMLNNLQTVKLSFKIDANVDLNDLKLLTKLKCLEFEIWNDEDHCEYFLDVSELNTLTDLRVSARGRVIDIALQVFPSHLRFRTLENFTVSQFMLDVDSLEQIVRAMPALKVLDIDDKVVGKSVLLFLQ